MRTLLLVVMAATAAANAEAKGTCANPGVTWTIDGLYVDGTPAAIQGDGAAYADGQSGVTAHINVCSGTYDATLLLSGRRSLSFSFARLLASNAYTPSWVLAGNTVSGAGFLNIRNLWFVPAGFTRNDEYTFTTWMGSNVPVSGSPGFDMLNPSPDATLTGGPNLAKANVPYPNSPVIAHHCPANTNTATCPNIVAETWFVYPDPNPTAAGTSPTGLPIATVGVLFASSKGSNVNAGEFSMPFLFTISMEN
jgi:hypothetical protein